VRLLLAAALLAACGGAGGDGDAGDDVPLDDSGQPIIPDAALGPDAGTCGALDGDPPWLDTMLADAVQTLAASPRASAARRDETRDWLIGELGAQGIPGELHTYGTGANVVARLPGSDASAGWILLGAHFDSVSGSPGANDNATGVAAVLASARLLRDTCRSRGVIIAFFDQEELGLIGAGYLAEDLDQDGEDVIAVHTIDQAGWDADNDRRFEIELPAPGLYAQYQTAAAALGLTTAQTTTAGSDHTAFRDLGFAAVGVTEEFAGGDTTPHYHEAGDTFATVELGYTADAVRLISRVVATAAE
jgi:hypothetical protein